MFPNNKIAVATKASRDTYDEILALERLNKPILPGKFWDVVVLIACDAEQKRAFDLQIGEKLRRQEIPKSADYHVLYDPPGPKIGCGGATMFAITSLKAIYDPTAITTKHILIIPTGGLSQRLPSASVLGKIFAPLPIRHNKDIPSNWQMLELKLACYLPLLARMGPGYFHAASDTVEAFYLEEPHTDTLLATTSDRLSYFTRPGLTALAHPSSVEIGTGHGVFVMGRGRQTPPLGNQLADVELIPCTKVLQKPSVKEMIDSSALIPTSCLPLDAPSRLPPSPPDFVYTDSAFYMDHSLADTLADFYSKEKPLNCEIDCYGDFMRMLGNPADWTLPTHGITPSDLVSSETKERLYAHLRSSGLPLGVVALNLSEFFHLGTVRECLDNFCRLSKDGGLTRYYDYDTLCFSYFERSASVPRSMDLSIVDYRGIGGLDLSPGRGAKDGDVRKTSIALKNENFLDCFGAMKGSDIADLYSLLDVEDLVSALSENPNRDYLKLTLLRRISIIHSYLGEGVRVGLGSVVEYCLFRGPGARVRVGAGCYLANLRYDSESDSSGNTGNLLEIPSDTFLCTVTIGTQGGQRKFVTLVFGVDDDIKKKAKINELPYLKSTLRSVISSWKCDIPCGLFGNRFGPPTERILSKDQGRELEEEVGSLYEARLFPALDSMEESFRFAVCQARRSLVSDCVSPRGDMENWFSAREAMIVKDVDGTLEYRRQLYDLLANKLS